MRIGLRRFDRFGRLPGFTVLALAVAAWGNAVAAAGDGAAATQAAREKFDAGQYLEAGKELAKELEKSPNDPELHFWAGRCAYELFEFNAAMEAFERAVRLQPENSLYHLWLGRAYSEKADREHSLSAARRTKKEFQEAVKLEPSRIPARRDLAEYETDAPWIAGGDKEDARRQAEAIGGLDRDDGELARAMIAWRGGKNVARAKEIYHRLMEQKPRRIAVYFEMARFFEYHGEPSEMEAAVEGAAGLDGKDARLPYFRGVVKFLEGNDLSEAERLLEEYLKSTPQRSDWPYHADALEWLGRVMEGEGKIADAKARYRECLRLDGNRKVARERLGRLEKE